MTPSLLIGVLVAWGVAQVALGAFFCLAFAIGRREYDYLLFGLLCFALALTTAGITTGSFAGPPEHWLFASKVAHAGAVIAPALNLHFALRAGAREQAKRLAPAVYVTALVFELCNLFDRWWVAGSARVESREVLGGILHFGRAEPTLFATAYYSLTALTLLGTQLLFLRAYRRGDKEALIACVGALFVGLSGLSDMLLLTGLVERLPFFLPHAFMLYAFAVASTLVLRYRRTAVELALAENHLTRAAEELRASHAELVEVQSTLETQAELAKVGELAASIAHEVRNPLAIISNAVAGLRRSAASPDDTRMLLDIVEEETARLNRLVTDLLLFARPAAARKDHVDLAELAQGEHWRGGRERSVTVKLDAAPARVQGDARLLRVAMANLVENACQASPEGGTVVVRISELEQSGRRLAMVEVRDQGPGMDAVVLARAKDPFYTTRPSGTGLGLPIVERVVRAHAGSFELETAPGEGTTARLVIPADAEEERA